MMETQISTLPEVTVEQTSEQNACRHHWLIEAPHGPVSRGECQYCHAEREFRNSMRGVDPVRHYRIDRSGYEAARHLPRPARKPIA